MNYQQILLLIAISLLILILSFIGYSMKKKMETTSYKYEISKCPKDYVVRNTEYDATSGEQKYKCEDNSANRIANNSDLSFIYPLDKTECERKQWAVENNVYWAGYSGVTLDCSV